MRIKTTTISLAVIFATLLFYYPSLSQVKPLSGKKNMASINAGTSIDRLKNSFLHPPAAAKPWVFWYWMQASVSKAGITADLEAMKEIGIGGAYLMPIKDTTSPPLLIPPVRQLSTEWWEMVHFAMQEAKRLDLQLAMHVSDGFALAGGPWITPEISMQKLVWTKTYLKHGDNGPVILSQPEANENYYKDVAVYAYPAGNLQVFSDTLLIPKVTASNGARAQFLSFANNSRESFKSDTACWIQYKYPGMFTCRSLTIHTGGNNYQAQRLLVQVSNDGENFRELTRLEPPRSGWQDTDAPITYAIPEVTARYFRFVYNKEGSEPGAEDLDAAKWKPSLKMMGIYLSDVPVIHQFESKNGMIWRVSKKTTPVQLPDRICVPLSSIIDLTGKMDENGKLDWKKPAGNWVVVRVGHTSTGYTNATGGAAKGLECDKFNPKAIKWQFDNWFSAAFTNTDPVLAKEVLKIFHVDSWECGSQNWSPVFREEFKKRRGYDLMPYLLAMTGIPIESVAISEAFLHDVRQTIAELVNDKFYGTLTKLAHDKGCSFSAESVAPTMVSDGMLHYQHSDIPMGEFWLNSPTHDKPNDMLDAISGAHIYGKNIVQAEAFTTVRMNWAEHPGMLKALGDRNFALGINKMVLHVYTHNPWLDRKPGMTLDGVGLYFQRDQTWWKPGKGWISYLQRCQALLQMGKPVVDVAVFTGEETPRRALLPDRLVTTLPGIFGKELVEKEAKRLKNAGTPLRQKPDGVSHSANMADPENWVDPLNGYAYDSFNPDALLRLATVKNNKIVLAGGAGYSVLILPAANPLSPEKKYMTHAVQQKIEQLAKEGATIIMTEKPVQSPSLQDKKENSTSALNFSTVTGTNVGKGRIITGTFTDASFDKLGIEPDLVVRDIKKQLTKGIAWTHRKGDDFDIYFISNQLDSARTLELSLRITGMQPELWDALSQQITTSLNWSIKNNRTILPVQLEANGSVFIVFTKPITKKVNSISKKKSIVKTGELKGPWTVSFDKNYGGPQQPVIFDQLSSWSVNEDSSIKYYSGTATYFKTFTWNSGNQSKETWLQLDSVANIAKVVLNGKDCGIVWTPPFKVNISTALQDGMNELKIEVTNTWANRLMGDQRLEPAKRITQTTAPFRLSGKPLLPAGLIGKAKLIY